nr:hypothetical protein [uncultured Psychroserpens sp.]
MNYFFHDTTGLVHLISAILALIFGTLVLLKLKGTRQHKLTGYLYTVSMIVLLVTSFMIYRLFKGFGIFHYSAIFSALNLIIGMSSILMKWPKNRYKFYHLNFMYWSVISLYMAFAAEVFTRIPGQPFFTMVYLSSGFVLVLGFIGYFNRLYYWKTIMGINKNKE